MADSAERVLVVTAVAAEAEAVLAGLDGVEPVRVGPYAGSRARTVAGEVLVLAGGVGPARAAACAATAVTLERPSLLVAAGIAGGFAPAAVGGIVVADSVVHADLGADSPDGFLPLRALGFGADSVALPADLVALAAGRTGGLVGPVLTVSTVTGTEERAAALVARHRPLAEAMEGAGVWAAAEPYGLPVLEVRAVSNAVGRRDRSGWDVPAALAALSRASAALFAGPLP